MSTPRRARKPDLSPDQLADAASALYRAMERSGMTAKLLLSKHLPRHSLLEVFTVWELEEAAAFLARLGITIAPAPGPDA